MTDEKKKLLVFVDTSEYAGHEADFRFTLGKALDKIPFWIFEDIAKTPEDIFTKTIGGILSSHAVLLDRGCQANDISSQLLIQYGICYALGKKSIIVSILNNSQKTDSETKNTIVEGGVEFDCYLDFASQFKSKFLEWFDTTKPVCSVKPNKLAVHSFIAFGLDRWEHPDLYEIISNFGIEKGWTPRIVSDIGSLSRLESLARAVSQRSFCAFCMNENNREEFFVGIGLAIGMGRPFLIIKHKSVELPKSLIGYHGIIEYESYSQLRDQLNKYTDKFLSDEIYDWEGATYNDLLSQLEKQIGRLKPTALNEIENMLLTVNSILGDTSAKAFALLGEVYREKNIKIAPDNIELLKTAKEYYGKALGIQKEYQLYQNAITAIDKHIQIVELIKEKRYRSIPTLINLIGGELKGDHYLQVREYLIGVVNKLVAEKDFVHAISLLAAMQIHDKSDDLKKLVQQVLNSAPLEIIKALQDSQKYVDELGKEKNQLTSHINEKDVQLEKNTKELKTSQSQLAVIKENLERIQKERDELSIKLKGFSAQLSEAHKTIDNLETEIETVKELGGRGVIVNFGYGWAIYEVLKTEPYIVRDGVRIPAQKGFPLKNGDIVYDEDGHQIEEYLPAGSIVIRPDQDNYHDVNNFLNGND